MRIFLVLIITICTLCSSHAQNDTKKNSNKITRGYVKVSADSTQTTEIPVAKFDIAFSMLPGQPIINGSMRNTFGNTVMNYADVNGSPYLNDDYLPGTVTLLNGEQYDGVPLQYDLYAGDIIAKVDDGKEIALNEKLYSAFTIPHNGNNMLFKKMNREEPQEFYIVLFENDDLAFFKKKSVTFREGENKGLAVVDAKFIDRNDYFITQGNKRFATKVKLKRKDFVKSLSRKKATDLNTYLDQNKVNLKKEEDFVKVLESVFEMK